MDVRRWLNRKIISIKNESDSSPTSASRFIWLRLPLLLAVAQMGLKRLSGLLPPFKSGSQQE